MTTPRVTVPVEPTEAMMKAADAVDWNNEDERASVINMWQATLSAAPAPEGGAVDREIARMREVARDWRRPSLAQVEGPNDLKIYGGTIADDIDRWADMIAALATREEAPAEAGAGCFERVVPSLEELFSVACYAPCMSDIANDRLRAHVKAIRSAVIAALRAQPPAREDAQPVACSACRECGCNFFAHPAPDALRVAVEALEAIKEVSGDRAASGYNETGRLARINERCDQVLAALQAEQKGGAA